MLACMANREGQELFSRSRQMPATPSWFTAALDQKPERCDVEVGGCRIRMRVWGAADQPPVVLVHGGGAHSGWWDHIAPFFSHTHRVIAPDLSGHGDSDPRDSYDLRIWAGEVMAAAAAAGPAGRPTIVGHSMGGWVVSTAAMHYSSKINSMLVIDSPLWERAPEEGRLRRRKHTEYRARNEILARFTAVPSQELILPYVREHIAAESIRKTSAGWVWKFDPAIFGGEFLQPTPADEESLESMLTAMRCRVGYLRCEAGLVPPAMAERIRSLLQLRGPFVELAQAGHHPMLDQPLPLVATLRTLLEFWSIT
ncbi:alpha/beta fold hydrolase [Mycobacterium avium]|uniref:alpha/beta fold hydrolase n=1 Tax=Mycobacterium avium TaxID=1764 RepID=UPI0003174CA8|nr:alpha/beta hydrolase [Mycobacterium avium]ETB09158.1 alpha/beta hydrolase [Mycobacterium avium subsp. paratuberculosis 08-8281]ETB35188.1 alpha/beta hydrolase [Mycobacterium avium subsp. paratuberculosis 11-1786]WAI54624.1 alpha/beta hydrolase [Mycobacterium avium subsp. paratuberculosis]WPS76675.1 alpha/beta hydrolase [Mycobacterium avium subsp. paratuberculosis]